MTNVMVESKIDKVISELFRVIGQPVCVRILLVISRGEACVCHLEAYLGERQATISHHLMAGLVEKHRDGRNIYYRLSRPDILDLVYQAASILGITAGELDACTSQPVHCTSARSAIRMNRDANHPGLIKQVLKPVIQWV